MRDLRFAFHTKLEFSSGVTDHSFLLRCIPWDDASQRLQSWQLSVRPLAGQGSYGCDAFGNKLFVGCIEDKHQLLEYSIEGRILRNGTAKAEPQPMPCYRYASPLTKPSASMKEFLAELAITATSEGMLKLSRGIYEYFDYEAGSTNIRTTAAEAFAKRQGVCQDFAHVFVSLARLAGLPARYVCGLPQGEGTTHAWGEIWYNGCWYGYDPTRNQLVDEGYITLAVGRDYGDCPVERGIFRGAADQLQTVFMQVQEQ